MRRRALLMALALAAAGCEVSEISDPLGLQVDVTLTGTSTIPGDLRLAVVWRAESEIAVGPDIALTSTTTPIRLDLTAPAPSDRAYDPLELFVVNPSIGVTMAAYRPRFVVYVDRDGSGTLGDGAGRLLPDTVIGIDGPSAGSEGYPTWLVNLEEELPALTAESAASYYRFTSDRYTSFVRTRPVAEGILAASATPEPLSVDISAHPFAAADVLCARRLGFGAQPAPAIEVRVDEAVDAAQICALSLGDCTSVAADLLEMPDLEPAPEGSRLTRYVQCRARADLEVLVIEERRTVCQTGACRCTTAISAQAVVTSTNATQPTWWPCGEDIAVCESNLPLYRADPACEPEEEDDP